MPTPLLPVGEYPRVVEIQDAVARLYGVDRTEIISSGRTNRVAYPRQVAMYLARMLTPLSTLEIGRRFGGRDHSTVLHAVNKLRHLVKRDADLSGKIDQLKWELRR